MSLDFSYKNVADKAAKVEHPAGDGRLHPMLETLIWACMGVGIGTIKEDNVREFHWRLRFLAKLEPDFGRIGFADGETRLPTLDDIGDYVGVSTNVTTIKSRKSWLATFEKMRVDLGYKADETTRAWFDRECKARLAAAAAKEAKSDA